MGHPSAVEATTCPPPVSTSSATDSNICININYKQNCDELMQLHICVLNKYMFKYAYMYIHKCRGNNADNVTDSGTNSTVSRYSGLVMQFEGIALPHQLGIPSWE